MEITNSNYLFIITVLSIIVFSVSIFSYLHAKPEGKFILETERLILREFTMKDDKALLKLFSDPDVMYFSVWGPMDMKGVYLFLRKTLKSYKEHGYGKWAVALKETGELIGACGIHNVKVDDEVLIEMGYRLVKKHWGKGFGTEAAVAIRNYAFETLQLPYVVSCMHPDNIASIKVAQKNGMIYWRDGVFFGVLCQVYGIKRDQWLNLKK